MSEGETRKGTDDSQYTLRAAAADAVGWAVIQCDSDKRRCDDDAARLTIRGGGNG